MAVLTQKSITMGIEEFLLDSAEKQGIAKGTEQGIAKGIEQGGEEAREEEQINAVTNLIVELGLNDEQISRGIKVPVNFVKSIRDRLKK